jgi:DNA-binding beta-propeller fold protein YncE
MKRKWLGRISLLVGVLWIPHLPAQAPPLKLIQTIPLRGYHGDFDHFAVDDQRNRLLLAAEDHATLEVFDLATMKHLRTIGGFGAPHSILIRPGASTILVTDSGPGMSKLLDASTYAQRGAVSLVPGADSIGYDAAANRVYIVTGGKDVKMKTSDVAAVDPGTGKNYDSIHFDSNHVEAMALEKHGDRLFINLTDKNELAVVNRKTGKILAYWPVPPAQTNSMVALDEASHRLYVVCRNPGMLVVMNSDTGAVVDSVPAPGIADGMAMDLASHRIYVPGGVGYIGVYNISNPDHPELLAKIPSATGAKTCILLPKLHRFIVARSPGDTNALAEVLVYEVQP